MFLLVPAYPGCPGQTAVKRLLLVGEWGCCYERVCVCLSVRPSASMSLKLLFRALPNFLCMLPMVVARSVLPWRRCGACPAVLTSGFMDHVNILSHDMLLETCRYGCGDQRWQWVSGSNLSGSRDPLTHDFVFFRHCRDLRHSLSHNVSLISLQ